MTKESKPIGKKTERKKPSEKKKAISIDDIQIANFKDVSPFEGLQKYRFDIMSGGEQIFSVFRIMKEGEEGINYRILPKDPLYTKEFYKYLKKKKKTIEEVIEEVIEKETKDDPIDNE